MYTYIPSFLDLQKRINLHSHQQLFSTQFVISCYFPLTFIFFFLFILTLSFLLPLGWTTQFTNLLSFVLCSPYDLTWVGSLQSELTFLRSRGPVFDLDELPYSTFKVLSTDFMNSSPPLPVFSLSEVSVTHGQPRSENIKWKFPEINNS